MITLTYKGKQVELRPGAQLNITGSNPAFDKDSIDRVFSFPFSIPMTPANAATFKHMNRLDARQQVSTQEQPPAAVFVDGSQFYTGYLTIGEVTQESVECSFANQGRKVLESWEKIKIRDLMPQIDVPQTVKAKWVFNVIFGPSIDYWVYINDAGIFTAGLGTLADTATAIKNNQNAVYPGMASYDFFANEITFLALDIDPFKIDVDGLDFVSSINLAQASQANFIAHVNSITATPVETHSFPVVRCQDFYASQNSAFLGYVNYQHDGVAGENISSTVREWAHTYVPFVKLKYVFNQIAAQNGLVWAGDIFDSQDFADLRIWSNNAIDKARLERDELFHWNYLNGFKTSYHLKDQVPDMTARDFINAVCDTLNLSIQSEGNTMYLLRRSDQIGKTPLNLDGKITSGYKMTSVVKQGFTLTFTPDKTDLDSEPGQLDNYVAGAGIEIITAPIQPLRDRQFFDSITETSWRMCVVQVKASSDELGMGVNAFPLRIFFDRGLQGDSDGLQYPMSTHLDTDTSGTVIGGLSLEWDGEQGLYQSLWKGWAELKDAQPMEVSAVLPTAQLGVIMKWQNPIVQYYHPLGEVKALIRSVQFTDSDDGMTFAKFSLLKL